MRRATTITNMQFTGGNAPWVGSWQVSDQTRRSTSWIRADDRTFCVWDGHGARCSVMDHTDLGAQNIRETMAMQTEECAKMFRDLKDGNVVEIITFEQLEFFDMTVMFNRGVEVDVLYAL